MADKRKQQLPIAHEDRRREPYDYRERRDRRIVNVALLGLAGCLGAVIADIGNIGGVLGMATIFGGLLAVPKFLEWDERRWNEPHEDS